MQCSIDGAFILFVRKNIWGSALYLAPRNDGH